MGILVLAADGTDIDVVPSTHGASDRNLWHSYVSLTNELRPTSPRTDGLDCTDGGAGAGEELEVERRACDARRHGAAVEI